MKKRIESVLYTNNKVSEVTNVKYSAKVLDKVFKGKSASLVIMDKAPFDIKEIGTVSKIKIVKYEDRVTVSGIVKTSLGISTKNKELKIGFLHDSNVDRSKMKAKDFKKIYFYFVDKKVEEALGLATKVGCNLVPADSSEVVTTAQMSFDELFLDSKLFCKNYEDEKAKQKAFNEQEVEVDKTKKKD